MGVGEAMIIGAAISAATTAAGAGVAYSSAQDQNRSLKKTAEANKRAQESEAKQLAIKASDEQRRSVKKAQQIAGRLRVAAGEAGVAGDVGSFALLDNQLGSEANTNINNTRLSNAFAMSRSAQQLDVALSELAGRRRSVAMDVFNGALGGLSTGVGMTGSLVGLGQANESAGRA